MDDVAKALDRDLSEEPITVLVVDDNESSREAMRMILKDRCSVFTARDAQEALLRLTASNLDVDIVALDLLLGETNGLELLQRIKQIAPDVEVFFITGYPSVESAVRAMRYGAYDYIIKPFDKNVVREVVRRGVLRQNQSLYERRIQIRQSQLGVSP